MNQSLRRIFELYVFAYVFFLASRPLSDGDFWLHLKTGEYIIRTGLVPKTDHFSFTNYGKPWIAHEWLSEAIFYVIYSRLGFSALIFIFAALTTLAFWIALRRSSGHPFVKGLAAVLGVWSILPTIGVRPRVFTLLLASVYLDLLIRYSRRGDGKSIWWLVPLMALWVNLHGGFLIGFVLIGFVIIGVFLDAWMASEKIRPLWPRIRTLGLALLGCLIVANLNPHGWRIYIFPFEIFFSRVQQQEILDWLSPNFHQPELQPLAFLILLTIAALALSPTRPRPSDILLFLVTLYATLRSNRHMAILAIVAVPLLADSLGSWIATTSFGKRLDRTRPRATFASTLLYGAILLLPLIAFAAKLRATVYATPKQEAIDVPLNAVKYMKESQITGNTFTDPNIWSGYLIWEMPSNPVYIDGRIDMYGDEFVREFLSIISGASDWREPFDRYGVRVVIVSPKSMLARELKDSQTWRPVFQDEMAVVFSRR